VDDVDRILWKKALELTGRERAPKCCQLNYAPGHVVANEAQLRNAVMGCKVAFVMFFGRACPYCHMFDPIFKQVGERYRAFANFVKADVEQFYHLAAALGVMGTPTTVAFVDGQPMEVAPGFMTAPQFKAFVESVLSYAGCR
jgi:thioredoxin 1